MLSDRRNGSENLPAQSQTFHHTVIMVIKFSGSYSPLQKQIVPTQTRENGFLQDGAILAHAIAPESQLPLNPSAQCTLKYWLSECSCKQGGTMIYPCFVDQRRRCEAVVSWIHIAVNLSPWISGSFSSTWLEQTLCYQHDHVFSPQQAR